MADLAACFFEPLIVFPSKLTTRPLVFSATHCVHDKKQRSNAMGSRAENTRLNVSCDGIPLGSFKNVLNHSSFACPYSAISFQPSAPQMTPLIEIKIMSSNKCSLQRAILGSGKFLKCDKGLSIFSPNFNPF